MKKIVGLIVMCVLAVSMTLPVMAAGGNVKYSGHAGEFIFEPGSEYSPTDLFSELKDVMPGDTLKQKIVIRNEGDTNVKISMRSLGAQDEAVKLLKELTLTVVQLSDTPLFEAAADQLTEWRTLGTLAPGGEIELEVTLQVPTTLDNSYTSLVEAIDWEFLAEELDGDGPKTGDYLNYLPWVIGLTTSVAVIIFVVAKRRKDRQETEQGGAAE